MKTLKDKKVIDRIFREGKKIQISSVYAKFIEGNSEVLISVPIKKFKRAVDRNKIKRMLRELVRTKTNKNISIALVYNSDKLEDFNKVRNDVDKIFNKLTTFSDI